MADFVLLHGTTQTAAGWGRISPALRRNGHRVFAIDLASRQQPFYTIADYASLVAELLDDRVRHPIVVAHSASGLLLPTVAATLEAQRQVWIAAIVPDVEGGRSLFEEYAAEPDLFGPEWVGVDPTADPILATYFLFHDCDLATLRWALSTVGLFSLVDTPYGERPNVPLDVAPSTYILPTADRTLGSEWMRSCARERLGVDPVEIEAGHCPHVAFGKELAELFDSLAD